MTANKNEPDKKPAGSPSAQAGSRPHATLDLKATEVTPPTPKPEAGQTSAAKPDAPQGCRGIRQVESRGRLARRLYLRCR